MRRVSIGLIGIVVMLAATVAAREPVVGLVLESPDGQYRIKVSSAAKTFTMPGDSGPGNTPIRVTLVNGDGRTIATSTGRPECRLVADSLFIRWDLDHDLVWFAKAKAFNVRTGAVLC